jgi:hypothetical protein
MAEPKLRPNLTDSCKIGPKFEFSKYGPWILYFEVFWDNLNFLERTEIWPNRKSSGKTDPKFDFSIKNYPSAKKYGPES